MNEELRKFLELVGQYREAEIEADKMPTRTNEQKAQNLGRLVDTKLKNLLDKYRQEVKALQMFTSG